MAEYIRGQGLDVLRGYEGTIFHEGFCPRGDSKVDGGTRRCSGPEKQFQPRVNLGRVPCSINDIDDVLTDDRVDIDLIENGA